MKIIQKRADELTTDDKLASADHSSYYEILHISQVEGEGTILTLKAPSGAKSVFVYAENCRAEVVA